MAIHEKVWERSRGAVERPFRPTATYALLAAIGAIWLLEFLAWSRSPALWSQLFVIHFDVWTQPWTLVTSTLSHSIYGLNRNGELVVDISHILFNGIFLFFFGPTLERIWGARKFVTWFFIGGALAGMAQVTASHLLGSGAGALGASGALMMVFGVLVVLMPYQKILIWGIVPIPFWGAAIGFVILDLIGFITPGDTVGRIAHLSGMALGLYLGVQTKNDLARRGLQLVHG